MVAVYMKTCDICTAGRHAAEGGQHEWGYTKDDGPAAWASLGHAITI